MPLPSPYALHAPPISFFSLLSPTQYFVSSIEHQVPHYAVFSIPLSPHTSYVSNNKIFIFKSCSLCIVAPYTTRNIQEIQFSSSGLHCLEADRQNRTTPYPGAVPSHWPKTNRREFLTIKQIAYCVKNTTTVHVYWYLIKATHSGLSLDHLQNYVHM